MAGPQLWRPAILVLALVIVMAHAIAPSFYSWRLRTISDLGSQGFPNAWLMRLGFLSFGLLLAASLRVPAAGQALSPVHLLVVGYGLAIAASGLWSAPPFLPGLPADAAQGLGHAIAANVAGLLLTLAMCASAFTSRKVADQMFDLGAFVVVCGLSLLFKLAQSGTVAVPPGIVQRLIFASGLAWLWVCAGRHG